MYYQNEQALLTAEKIVEWKRRRGVYNFSDLPDKAIIGLGSNIFKPYTGLFAHKLKGIPGIHCVKGSYVFCSGFGSGAPALVTLMEELRALGVKEFIFIGLCAALAPDITSGQVFYIEKAFSESGITISYTPDKMVLSYNQEYVQKIGRQCTPDAATCISTDSPFRETPAFINRALEQNCSLLEMECAAAYAFSQFYRLNVVCLQVVADRIWPSWTPPADMQSLIVTQQLLIGKIIQNQL